MSDVAGILGLATRSRKVCTGETIFKKLRSNDVYLLLIAEDIGENTKKKLQDKCKFYNVPYVYMNEKVMNQAIGDRNRKSVAIVDKGFAQKLHACLKG